MVMAETEIEFVKAIYRYTGGDQAVVPLSFVESTILLVVERTQDGWCRGFAAGKEGWFPISYVKPLANRELLQVGKTPRGSKGLFPLQIYILEQACRFIAS